MKYAIDQFEYDNEKPEYNVSIFVVRFWKLNDAGLIHI